jgi:hypothetical protein
MLSGVALAADTAKPNLDGIKTYLLDKSTKLETSAQDLQKASDAYYELAKAAEFDYKGLWSARKDDVSKALLDAKTAWIAASPLYEQMEGIVAGVPSLVKYDPILDSGVKGEVEFDVTLPDGKVMEKPGNLFGLLETSLWGTNPDFVQLKADLDGNGKADFGEVLPDANLLKGFADSMSSYSTNLLKSAQDWQPTATDAFTALVIMTPTMSEYFESWKTSRFVLGDKAEHGDFSVISRLSDVKDIVSSLEVIYAGVSPLVAEQSPDQDKQIGQGLTDLRKFAADLFEQEEKGKRFKPEEADFFGTEAQNRATAITGQITQVAALLDIKLPESQ